MALIFHASDLHFGAEDRDVLDWFAAQTERYRPDAILVTGDLTMRARRQEFAAAREWLSALPAPVSVEVGNHDLPRANLFARMARPYHRFRAVQQFIQRPIDLPGVAIVPLQTTARWQWRLDWSKGMVAARRLAAAAGSIAASTRRHRIVACHHPLIEPGTATSARTRRGTAALEMLARAGATAVLSGHVHDPFDRVVEIGGQPVRLIGAGTLSERVRASLPSYNALTTSESGLEVEVRYAV